MTSIPRSIGAGNGHAIAVLTGYEDDEVLAWDQACIQACDRLAATPTSPLATAEKTRLAKGLDLARAGAVILHDAHARTVEGSQGPYTWGSGQGCPCPDHLRYPTTLCKHMIAALIHEEALYAPSSAPSALPVGPLPLAQAPARADQSAALPCPEAAFSLCLQVAVLGRHGQLTVRGQTIAEFTANLHAVRALLLECDSPDVPATEPGSDAAQHVCAWHGVMRPSTKVPNTYYCPGTMADGSYCKARWPEAKAAASGK